VRAAALADPRSFLEAFPPPVIFAKSSTPPSSCPTSRSASTAQEDLGDRAGAGYVVHPGDVRLPLGPEVQALPFYDL
jgi:hypothetical protein